MNRLTTYIASGLLAIAASSCSDDRLWNADDPIGTGEATISATVGFKTFEPALEKSRTSGSALDGIEKITILAYDQTGEKLIDSKVYTDLTFTENTQKPADGVDVDNTVPTQKTTLSDFNLSYGKYKVYVVANADIIAEDVSSEAKLKAITFDWQSDISKNNQMFGWFEAKEPGAISGNGLDAPVITINKSSIALNAWLVRLGSKVTVSYDASELNENVFIFLKSVQIKDIPVSCALGERNTPSESSDLIADGEKILYYEGAEPTINDFNINYPALLTRGNNKYGSDHSHNADALFFYENDQGIGKNKGQDVVDNNTNGQTPGGEFNPGSGSSDGKIDFPDGNSNAENTGFKDEKRYGTYIEVKAYYRSNNSERLGEGEITYRFMLGKNITDNYEALRNYHYKLTLKFNKFANDVDWHIEYTPDPDIIIPNPYYISYLYDKTMDLPVQINGEIKEGTKITATIIENHWWPSDYENDNAPAPKTQYYDPDQLNWNQTNHVWNGFLSLANTGNTTQIGEGTDASGANGFNKNYYEKKITDDVTRGKRSYTITEGIHGSEDVGEYIVEKNDEGILLTVPLYTRAKNLVKASGYTGNNPYVSYQRTAVVRFTATFKDKDGDTVTKSKDVTVVQVRRVVNPKGIWRAHDEDGEFKVHLTRLETEFTTDPWQSTGEFKTFSSNGPWSAEVLVEGGYDSNTNTPYTYSPGTWIELTSDGESIARDNVITGTTGSEIKFKYKPKGTITANMVRYGIIKVRYHNYTCEHLIFVRQGYAPIPVATVAYSNLPYLIEHRPRKWFSFNMRSQTEMAESPCEEGSMFKFAAWSLPINAVNNKTNAPYDANPDENGLWIYPNKSGIGEKWDDIKPSEEERKELRFWGTPNAPAMPGVNKSNEQRVAMLEDYMDLYNDPDVQMGYGILYDGKADEVQIPVKDAYSYYYDEPNGSNGKGRGMRGVFVYNGKTGAQIFLPAGASGYGRRKRNSSIYNFKTFFPGELHYANRNIAMEESDSPWDKPLLWDLYRRPGGCYWTYKENSGLLINGAEDTKNSMGWDFNYITFDFYPISRDNISNADHTNTDALLIRCVQRP